MAVIVLLISRARVPQERVQAQDGPDRIAWITVDSTSYDWWLAYWTDNHITCQFTIHHDGTPTPSGIQDTCGNSVYQAWLNTPPCNAAQEGKDTSVPVKLYLQHSVTEAGKKRNPGGAAPRGSVAFHSRKSDRGGYCKQMGRAVNRCWF